MKKINEIIVVEGKSDKQFLETFLNADILTCNGSAIDGFDKNYDGYFKNTYRIVNYMTYYFVYCHLASAFDCQIP